MGIELAATTATKSGGFPTQTLLFIAVIGLAFYMLMIRPQQRRRQQAQQKQDTIRPGARVRTTAGMYATVVDVDGDDVVLEIAPGIEVRYMKRAVMDVVSVPEEEDVAPADETDTGYYEDAEPADDAESADDVADAADTAHANGSAPAAKTDTDDTAYEQATGTKKD
jgi:preprotein translocase subunit YajC